jgi:tRNA(fMet)-specific endonuclease VapC
LASILDTDVAIELRDRDPWIKGRIEQLALPLYISAITYVELENGVHREPQWAKIRRAAVDHLLKNVIPLDFGPNEIAAYRRILEATGYSRRKTADRMTAATALVHGLPLVTLNGRDFRDVPGLELIEWERAGDGRP